MDSAVQRGSKMTTTPKPRDTRITEKAHYAALMAQAADFYRQRDFLLTAMREIDRGEATFDSVLKMFAVLWPDVLLHLQEEVSADG